MPKSSKTEIINKDILKQIEEIHNNFLLELKEIEHKRYLKIKAILKKKDEEVLADTLTRVKNS